MGRMETNCPSKGSVFDHFWHQELGQWNRWQRLGIGLGRKAYGKTKPKLICKTTWSFLPFPLQFLFLSNLFGEREMRNQTKHYEGVFTGWSSCIAALSNRPGESLSPETLHFSLKPPLSNLQTPILRSICTFFCNEMNQRGQWIRGKPSTCSKPWWTPLWPGRRLFLALCHCLVRTVEMFAKQKCLQSQHVSWGCVWKTIQKRSQHSTPPCAFNCCNFFTRHGVWANFSGFMCLFSHVCSFFGQKLPCFPLLQSFRIVLQCHPRFGACEKKNCRERSTSFHP